MNRLIALALALLIPALVQSQSAIAPQTQFGAEGTFQKPAQLPSGALAVLRSDTFRKMLPYCADEQDTKANKIPADWFVASELELKRGAPGLIVRGVLTQSPSGWRIVFSGRGDSLEILNTRTSMYRDVQLASVMSAGGSIQYITFQYSRGKYRQARSRVVEQQ